MTPCGDPTGNTVGSLTSTQHAVLIGSLLGDGTLRRQRGKLNALLEVNHAYAFKEYVDFKHDVFKEYVLTPPKRRKGNGKRVAYRFTTRSLPVFTRYFDRFYPDGHKLVPRDLKLSPLALAVWYMDDGSKSRSACYLNTQQLKREDQEALQGILRDQFSIESNLNRDKQYTRIRVTTEGTTKLFELVRPHVIDCFRYKLGEDPVTTDLKREASGESSGQYATSRRP
jgi:hypothetical protein